MDAGVLILLAASVVVVIVVAALVRRFSGDSTPAGPPPEGTTSELETVEVQHVIDGDTVIVSTSWSSIRIRLAAIDCPEDGQPWGDTATAGLIKLIGGRLVDVEAHGVDIHGRTLATLYVQHDDGSDWINVNERMVMLGHAWVMRHYLSQLPKSRQQQLTKLEGWARAKRVGLWKTSNPIPPWQWRQEE